MRDKVDVNDLPRPAPGTSKVPVPESGIGQTIDCQPQKLDAGEEPGEAVDGLPVGSSAVAKTGNKSASIRTKASLQPHQKHSIAMAVVNGLPVSEIAGMVRHTPAYVKRCIEDDNEIADLVQHYSSMSMKAAVEHRFAMLDRLEAAYRVLDDALLDTDMRVRMQAMDRVFNTTAPAAETGPTVEMNFTDPEAHKALQEATLGIRDLMSKIVNGNVIAPPVEKHLRNSTLPGPEDVLGHERQDD